jgi:hypothetical protein
MPYIINKVDNKYELRLEKNNKLLGSHKTKKEAQNQIKAIEANKKDYSIIDGLIFQKSEKKNKKLKVYKNNNWIHFGDNRYQHFFDKTTLLNPDLNHFDPIRRQKYLNRALNIRDKEGNLTAYEKNSPNYYAVNYLW